MFSEFHMIVPEVFSHTVLLFGFGAFFVADLGQARREFPRVSQRFPKGFPRGSQCECFGEADA